MTQTATQNVVEITTFKLASGVSPDHYISLSKTTNAFVENSPGFIFRRLSSGDDGYWTDTVIWTDLNAAKTAFEAFPKQGFAQDIMAAIDGDTLKMRHETIHNTQGPSADQ
ncbi:MAG: hypothetical protein KUG70_00425 [Rhodobacteraceae bacterium]|nr:hypothetical protein [Paracoccaceae bacterium]